MNIYIIADMEGISGILNPEQVNTDDGKCYSSEGRLYMTRDVNACVEGCIAAGADKIILRDAHGRGRNLIWEELSPKAEYIIGATGEKRMPGIEECDAVILLGYHAMAGTPGAILEHTWSSGWQNFWLNGRLAGEIAIDAGIAADYGKPVIMVSGDDKACSEAAQWIPGIVSAQVKCGLTLTGGRFLPKEAAHTLIRNKVREAIEKFDRISPLKVERPVTMRLEMAERNQLPSTSGKTYIKVIDGRTYEVTADTVEQALFRLCQV